MEQGRKSDSLDTSAGSASRGKTVREPYHRPELIEYGSVAKLTQGTLTTQSDAKTGGFKAASKACL